MPITDAQLLALWERADQCEVGIAIPTDDWRFVLNGLYRVREEYTDDEFAHLMISVYSEEELWIVRKGLEVPP